jgi:hypothetical protein
MIPILTQIKPLYTSPPYFVTIHFNTCLFVSRFPTKIPYAFLTFFMCVTYHIHLIFLGVSIIFWEVDLKKLLICSFLKLHLISFSHFSKGINLGPFLDMTDKVSREFKTWKTYFSLTHVAQKMGGRRILNWILLSISQIQCALIYFTNAVFILL